MKSLSRVPRLVVGVILVLFAVFPLYWMINTALSSSDQLYGSGQLLWPNFGVAAQTVDGLLSSPIFRWLGNSAIIAVGTTVLSLVLATLGAYALSRYKFHGRGVAGVLLFTTQMLPEAFIVVPLYALFSTLGLLNNLGGLVLTDTAFTMPVGLWILKSAMDKIPYEIEESARVDGCPQFGILSMLIVPLILPSIAAAAVINFFDGWNEYLFAVTFISDKSSWPASVGLASLIGQYQINLPVIMASAITFTLPALIFFLFVQRQIVSGLTAGAVKG